MDPLFIEESFRTPKVDLNPKEGKFVFAGRSLPENPTEFYGDVVKWMEQYAKNPIPNAEFEFRMTYFNTASSKVFFTIFQVIDKLNVSKPGSDNKIVIYANEDDEDLIELFEYYQELLTSNCLELKNF
ncbi:MAG TPA: hypothetical protein DCX54_06775 [Flavobacteriales bacterium]|nr:hypothetical protein [Flavobacteriales bacterium]